jgi:hypothetical protein
LRSGTSELHDAKYRSAIEVLEREINEMGFLVDGDRMVEAPG